MNPEEVPMLSQPLMTEDGFVNPACLNELAQAIKNIPPIYLRVDDDPEWNRPRWLFVSDICASFAKCAVKQSPYGCPVHLENVVKYLNACLKTAVKWDTAGMAQLTLKQIGKLLYDILYDQGISQFDAWNVAKREQTAEEKQDMFSNFRHPDADYIDLDALLTNVCIDLRNDCRIHDAFDKEFEEKYGHLE